MLLQTVEQTTCGNLELAELIRQHSRRVLQLAHRLTGNPHDAEDIAQEVFLRLHRQISKEGGELEPAKWLYRVTVNLCYDYGRSRKRWKGAELDERIIPSSDATPEKMAIRREHQALVEQALTMLSERERAALILREMEGLSTAEVAEVLGSTESTVRVQIASARLKLRKLIGFIRENKR